MSENNDIHEEIDEIDETDETQPKDIIQKKTRKSPKPLTEAQKEQKRKLLEKGRAVKKANQEELKKYREQEKMAQVVEKPVEEVKQKKPKKKIVREIVKEEYETDSDTEEEVVERVIVKKIPRQPKEYSKNELISQTYRERLQEQLKAEKMKMIYNSLFDF